MSSYTSNSPAAKRQRTQTPTASATSSATPASAATTAVSASIVAPQQASRIMEDDEDSDASSSGEEDFTDQSVSEWSARKRQRRADADAQELHDAGVKATQLAPFLRALFNGAEHPLPYLPPELSGLIAEYSLPPAEAQGPAVAWQLEATASLGGYACQLEDGLLFRCEADARAHVLNLLRKVQGRNEANDGQRSLYSLLKEFNSLSHDDRGYGRIWISELRF